MVKVGKKQNKSEQGYATKTYVDNTVDKLAILVNRGFENLEKRFDTIDKSFVKTNELIFKIDEKFTKRFDDLQYQINRLENYILKDHEHRLQAVESKLGINRE